MEAVIREVRKKLEQITDGFVAVSEDGKLILIRVENIKGKATEPEIRTAIAECYGKQKYDHD